MDANTLSNIALLTVTLLGMYLSAFWLALIIWTYRDHRTRSRDGLASIAAALTVAVLNVPGLFIYLLLRPKETLVEAYERSLEEEALLQEIEERPVCPGCGRPTALDWQICAYCHTTLKKNCDNCGKLLDLTWEICPYCVAQQSATREPQLRPTPPRERSYSQEQYAPASQPQNVYAGGVEAVEFVDEEQY